MARNTTPKLHVLALFAAITWYSTSAANSGGDLHCTDFQGRPVAQSEEFVPRAGDPCMTCTCEDGFPVMCTSVLCSPPDCELLEAIDGECCRFNCIEPPIEKPGSGHNITGSVNTNLTDTTNLGLRLVASTVTSLLILALLLFMIHRLRQRRTLITMRRLNAERQEEDAVAYMTQIDQVDIGIEFPPYEDPPPPYTPPKPEEIPMGESPPPYEENPSTGENEPGNNNNNTDRTNNERTRNGIHCNEGARPNQGRGRNSSQTGGCHSNGTVGRQNQRNQEMSQSNERCHGNVDARQGRSNTTTTNSGTNTTNGTISRGRVIESLLGRASSSRSQTLPPASGRKKDKKCARKSTTSDNYGLSVALATLGGGERTPETSPSRVMVHMRNNSPQSSLVRFEEEPSTSGGINSVGPLPDVANVESVRRQEQGTPREGRSPGPRDRPRPDSWTHFIKKSDSIEIKRGSNSPRNSFYLEDKHFQPDCPGACGEGREGRRQTPGNTAANAAQPFGPNLVLLGAIGPGNLRSTKDDSCVPARHASGDDVMSKSTSCVEEGSCDQTRQSVPPMILDLPIREASKRTALTPETVNPAVSSRGNLSSGPATSSSGTAATGRSRSSPGFAAESPTSPFPAHNTRSGSVASNASIFSVCSETGERKNPNAAAIPYALRNDVQYPLSPLTSLHSVTTATAAPTDNPLSAPAGGSAHSNPTSGEDRTSEVAPTSGTQGDVTASHARTGRLIYRDPDELAEASTGSSCDAGVKSKVGEGEAEGKGSGRRKGKKRRSVREEGESPEGRRKERSSSFKQYGFVDRPEVLKGEVFPSTGDQVPHPALGEKVRRRSSSRERRNSGGKSRRRGASGGRHSRESSKSRSRSRERSRSRGRGAESPGAERRRKRRARNAAPADIPSDVAVVNGDLEYSARRHSHKSRSPSRCAKQRSVTDSNHGNQTMARREDVENANTTVLDSEHHDNIATTVATAGVPLETTGNPLPSNGRGETAACNLGNQIKPGQPHHSMIIDR